MGLFKNILKENESIFKNHIALDLDYTPKRYMYREKEQGLMISCIKLLLEKKNGRNLIITGKPGIGKTLACKKVLEALETEEIPSEAEQVDTFYINCWKRNTSYKIMLELCEKVNYKFTQNKNTEELFNIIKGVLNKKSSVFVFDEIDKIEDFGFLYMILEEIYRKSIFMITNNREWSFNLDKRIKSRLIPEIVNFKPYNLNEVNGILRQRMESAFYDNIWENEAFEHLVKKTYELEDIRSGLFLMRESGQIAENDSSKKINKEYVEKSIEKLDSFFIKSSDTLKDETRVIFNIIKKHSNIKSGELFKIYQKEGGKIAYKTFQRNIKKLQQDKFISVKKIIGGVDGSTSIINLNINKKLSDF